MAEAAITPMSVDLEPVQLVAPDGTPTAEARYSRALPAETLCWLYEMMVVTREVDAEFVNLQRQGELALFASCCGQEAAQVGAAACLRKTDWLFPQYRELGVYLVRGIPPGHVGAAWRGTWHGGLDFTKKCCAPISVPIGTQTLHAVGVRDPRPAARRGLNDGGVPRRWRHQRGRRARGTELRGGVQSAVCVLRAKQPVGDLGAAAQPDCRAVDRAQGDRVWHARRPGGRQRRAGLLCGDGRSRRPGQSRRRADAD